MFKRLLLVLLFSTSASNAEEKLQITKLQCEGKHYHALPEGPRSHPISGIYLKITKDYVNIIGAGFFDGSYSILNSSENEVRIEMESNELVGGLINRLSGKLMLHEKYRETSGINQWLNAECEKVKPIF